MSPPFASTIARRARAVALLLVALGVSALLIVARAPSARANPQQVSIMMDDDHLVYGNDATRIATLAQMKALGVDFVRVTILWSNLALGMRHYDHQHHIHFNQANPAAYPAHNWDRYDRLVTNANTDGIGVYFDVTGPGPAYTHGVAPARLRAVAATWMPDPRQFYQFVTAVGRRYSGTYRVHRQLIPRVTLWSLWNEPNQGGWITPQWYRVQGQLIPYSAVLYRRLYLYGRQALQLTGHGRDRILMGETSPLGTSRRTETSEIDPTTFIRELMCAGPDDQPYTGAAAAIRSCADFTKFGGAFAATGWAHHPYTKFDAPTQVNANPNAITVANISALPNLLDTLALTTHRIAGGLPIVASEDGYETNPPDPFSGIPLATQAEYINLDDFLLWVNPRVYANTQFLLRDAAPLRRYRRGSRKYWSTYQSGLEFDNGRPKPSLLAYRLPFVTFPIARDPFTGAPRLAVWGRLRFLAHSPIGAFVNRVYVQYQALGAPASAWRTIGSPIPVTDTVHHFFVGVAPDPGPGHVRLYYNGGGVAPNGLSRVVALTG